MKKILFVTSELYPLIKTGGLADVSHSLSEALAKLGHDVTVALPGYPDVLNGTGEVLEKLPITGLGIHPETEIWLTRLPESSLKLWLVVCPALFDRPGNPYQNDQKEDWPDNAYRFGSFCRTVVELIIHHARIAWKPDVVHCNDWQSGLVPALLSLQVVPPATVMTIHNLAYQGNFPRAAMAELHLPERWWAIEYLEFYGMLSFLKAGIVFADKVTTVSPSYAQEILTKEFGCGLEGLLQYHKEKLIGILNGIDYRVWNPETDPYVPFPYNLNSLDNKADNKRALQRQLGFRASPNHLLVGVVSRLVYQKGFDLLLAAIQSLLDEQINWVILGSGDPEIEQALLTLAREFPDKVSVTLGYNEPLAHQIEAATDLFAMPSRYEPCGLNQLYSLRYGTLPLVRNTGGLADTVIDATTNNLAEGRATGFKFTEPKAELLIQTLIKALALFQKTAIWQAMQRTAMSQDFSWDKSALTYVALYDELLLSIVIGAPRHAPAS